MHFLWKGRVFGGIEKENLEKCSLDKYTVLDDIFQQRAVTPLVLAFSREKIALKSVHERTAAKLYVVNFRQMARPWLLGVQ